MGILLAVCRDQEVNSPQNCGSYRMRVHAHEDLEADVLDCFPGILNQLQVLIIFDIIEIRAQGFYGLETVHVLRTGAAEAVRGGNLLRNAALQHRLVTLSGEW